MHIFKHFVTITKHRHAVMKNCFRAGIVWRGLLHDLSKYNPVEFFPGAKYYQGTRSPHARERELYGYSKPWLHHKGRNKHHFEYWTEFRADGNWLYVEMPAQYLAEMICDRIAASKIYLKEKYTDKASLDYLMSKNDIKCMHPNTAEKLICFLTLLANEGEKVMFTALKHYVKENK